MKRTFCISALCLCMASPALADVTVTSQVTGKGIAKGGAGQSVTYIKGLKMRADTTSGNDAMSTIMDLDGQKFISLDHKKKEALVFDMAEFRQIVDKGMKGGAVDASLKPNGQTKDVAGKSCTGYDVAVTMPLAAGEGAEMKMVLTGPVYIAKGAPGTEDYKKFYLAAAEKGFIASDPRQAKGAPQQTKGMTELYKSIADSGGIPYFMEMAMKIDGGGPMAGMMNRMMGGAAFSNTVTAVSTDAIAADRFDIPAGYKVKDGK